MRRRSILRLSAAETWLAAIALPLTAAIRVALRVLPSPVILRWVAGIAGERGQARRRPRATPETVAWAVEAAGDRVPGTTCLARAIVCQLLLRSTGHDPQLVLGVGPMSATVRAHAWVELHGNVLVGGRESRGLVRMPALPRGAR